MIILASQSERRREILSKFTDFKIITEEVEENNSDYVDAKQLVMALSFEKGIGVALKNPESVVLSADTVVDFKGKILGKPAHRAEAKKMLEALSGEAHEVYTAYSIFHMTKNLKYTNYEVSKVYFKKLSDDDIENYLNTDEYKGKAGAYAIQGYASLFVERIEGDFLNIVGLPISKISDDMKKFLNISLMERVKVGK
ncbi:septum formation protein Maf [Peptoniphilus sp. ING2-D1G]|nr:septum formation protein Maf [Peptoniphilus sp. ING2-D1G]